MSFGVHRPDPNSVRNLANLTAAQISAGIQPVEEVPELLGGVNIPEAHNQEMSSSVINIRIIQDQLSKLERQNYDEERTKYKRRRTKREQEPPRNLPSSVPLASEPTLTNLPKDRAFDSDANNSRNLR